jgi:DNA-binding transcriptional LysR family regulator
MQVFVETARHQSFSKAGKELRLSASAISKVVSRLEQRLGTRLMVRSTRSLQLTPEGEIYLARAQRILDDIRETEEIVASAQAAGPRGRIRVSASVAFGVRYIVPLVPEFLASFPDVQLDLALTDGIIDIVGERADIAIRSGNLPDTSLIARKLMDSQRVIVASPEYLRAHGTPTIPGDLEDHNCMTFDFRQSWEEWPFKDPQTGNVYKLTVRGNFETNNGPTMRSLCLAGMGLARVGRFHVQPDIEAGLLVPVLEEHNGGDIEPINAVFAGHPHLAKRIRAFIDFVSERL